ncbi:hypothetical protein [Streptomyces sp. GQFP]|uniref:hypothetical protein n=1 Tax=Streptomyces sp. GQFP TaxID=2907545 RepID=UPI001F421E9A|nr:hypothetical protein [Streptomyces sp. GQFP]UIX29828.1 hypothetical protein LUX31_07130 [Streptomyces sp. GQFP]
MAVEQLPGQVREFARYLNGLLARLDQGAGWCGVFWQRDPDGMRACLEGHEVPPWDVVEALLQDLATEYGTGAVTPEAERARALHQASLTAFDTRPGARDTLGDRLDVMLREQKYAAERLAELGRLLNSAGTHEEAEGFRLDLAWAHDDHERATARCAELRSRLDQLARRAVSGATIPRRDPDDEAGLFAARVQNVQHPADALNLPRQRTDLDTDEHRPPGDPAAWHDDEDGVRGQRSVDGTVVGYEDGRGARRQGAAEDMAGWYDGEGGVRGQRSVDGTVVGYEDGRGARRQGAAEDMAGWHDGEGGVRGQRSVDATAVGYEEERGARRQGAAEDMAGWHDGEDGARRQGAVDGTAGWHDDERGPRRQGADDRQAAGYENGRGSQPQAPDGSGPARHGDDRGPGEPGSDDLRPWRGHSRRSGGADDRDDPRQADAPDTPEPAVERTTPQLPADWYDPPAPAVTPEPEPDPVPVPEPGRASKQRSKRRTRGSARFAGMMDDADTGATPTVDPTSMPVMPTPAAPTRRTPRGARFAGSAVAAQPAAPKREALDDDARHDTIDAVRSLVRLRSEGRSGEAHALLVEAAYWPAARFPLLAAELHRAGLGADWATLLWEAASLPAGRLVAAADALVAAGRGNDGQQILRQGIVRPAHEVGEAVLGLVEEGRQREARALLDAYVRVRTPEEAARSVGPDPQHLVPLLLEAARGASEDCYWDLVHALRVAGHSA